MEIFNVNPAAAASTVADGICACSEELSPFARFAAHIHHLLSLDSLTLTDEHDISFVFAGLMKAHAGNVDMCISDATELFLQEVFCDDGEGKKQVDLKKIYFVFCLQNFIAYFRPCCSDDKPNIYSSLVQTAEMYLKQL